MKSGSCEGEGRSITDEEGDGGLGWMDMGDPAPVGEVHCIACISMVVSLSC